MELDVLLRRAEARVAVGRAFSDAFVSALCIKSAILAKNAKSFLPEGVQGSLDFSFAAK